MQQIDVVVGGQYGSEAKGHVTAQLVAGTVSHRETTASDYQIWNVRVAGPNAGHTAYDRDGRKFAFRTLPIGAIVDQDVLLYIAPGSEIDLEVLQDEIQQAENAGWKVGNRLYISKQATLLERRHKTEESNMELVGRVGSTGKGIGAARSDRIMRIARTMGQWWEEEGKSDLNWARENKTRPRHWVWAEPEDIYADDVHAQRDTHIIIEGTQGYGLSLRASRNYPQVTSSDCRSVDFLSMAGIDPTRTDVNIQNWVVARVYPIRVAGNSGPMKGETTWEELGLEPEKTTVTQKVRRVGEWDVELLRRAVQANGGKNANVVITMLDQILPELRNLDEQSVSLMNEERREALFAGAKEWIETNASEEQIGAKVVAFTYSPTAMWSYPEHDAGEEDNADTEVELRNWWINNATYAIDSMVNKMFEYGGASRATDLTQIGKALVDAGVRTENYTEAQLQELGAYFYLQGKIARWAAAVGEGRQVSDDTIHDIAVYATMVQRIRAVGGWPV